MILKVIKSDILRYDSVTIFLNRGQKWKCIKDYRNRPTYIKRDTIYIKVDNEFINEHFKVIER